MKPAERKEAEKLFKSAAGKLMEADVQAEAGTFTPGEGLDTNPMSKLTPEQKEQVRAAIAAASTPEEVSGASRA